VKQKINATISVVICGCLTLLLTSRLFNAPAMGDFLNPATGFWQNMDSPQMQASGELNSANLKESVVIKLDNSKIPHIFAKNEYDLYFTQGFVTAGDRLWQMDIQMRRAAGRLAEVTGARSLNSDFYYRRIGLPKAAELSTQKMMADPQLKLILTAYTDGVNAYIAQLKPKDYPLEFKLLGYQPQKWQVGNIALLLKLMAETLTGGSDDFAMSNSLKKFGVKATNDLYPDEDFRKAPIIPDNIEAQPVEKQVSHAPELLSVIPTARPKERVEGIGSNNWVVAANKTKNGFPILANDPHLDLTYPSIWYQVQLNAPGVNVYGVSIPGIPCVVSGFNQNISWGVTNVDADVLDWYQETFKDNSRNEYWYNNQWNKVTKRVEKIQVRDGATLTDTVRYTCHGPVVYDNSKQKPQFYNKAYSVPIGHAMKWIGAEPSADLKTFYLLNKAGNYPDFKEALLYYTAPAQNFIFADNHQDIAISVNGKFPVKDKDQGKFLLDGSKVENNWKGWIPMQSNPASLNPARGYLCSANQTPTTSAYPYYLNWQFAPPERALRLNERLSAMKNITVNDMVALQNDNYSIIAREVLPVMLSLINRNSLTTNQQSCYNELLQWDKTYDCNSKGATIFNMFWNNFYQNLWDNKFEANTLVKLPSRDRTVKLLLTDRASNWFDKVNTARHETCADIINESFFACADTLKRHYGNKGTNWEWGKTRPVTIRHLLGIPALGSGMLCLGGSGSTVNAMNADHGPSWRMVVEVGTEIKAYGILPGGESGNPGSLYYDNELKDWETGHLRPLIFLANANVANKGILSSITFKNK
jgi:penicillin amidase